MLLKKYLNFLTIALMMATSLTASNLQKDRLSDLITDAQSIIFDDLNPLFFIYIGPLISKTFHQKSENYLKKKFPRLLNDFLDGDDDSSYQYRDLFIAQICASFSSDERGLNYKDIDFDDFLKLLLQIFSNLNTESFTYYLKTKLNLIVALSENRNFLLVGTNAKFIKDSPSICTQIARRGNLSFLEYAVKNGGEWDEKTCDSAARGGHLECLKYAFENGAQLGPDSSYFAAKSGHLDCLRFVLEQGGEFNINTSSAAAESGSLACLKYAHEKGAWSDNTCSIAACEGFLAILIYAHEEGAPWNALTCSFAAGHGQLECLQYAHKNGCDWDENTCSYAARGGHVACLKYAHDNGLPWDENTIQYINEGNSIECKEYLKQAHP